jgi:TRAP-type C4-dicarboxylate transport system permease large subunit
MSLLLALLAAIGIVVLVQQVTRTDKPGTWWVNLLPALAALMGLVSVLMALRGGWLVAIPAAAGAVAAFWRSRQIAKALDPSRPQPLPSSNVMTVEEAGAVLGLSAGASADDVRAAHRKLIQQLHPDQGGTSYLAAKINQARDVLLAHLETPQ